jgi:histidine triad (HIT) family protein
MEECIFCKIIAGEIPSAKVYEDEDVLAFLDIGPCTDKGGHTLVLPKKHFELVSEMPEDLLCKVMAVTKKLSTILLKRADGVNILQNNKKAAGQLVPHVHFHVMPRYKEDDVQVSWTPHKYAEGEMEKVQEEIKKLLNEG